MLTPAFYTSLNPYSLSLLLSSQFTTYPYFQCPKSLFMLLPRRRVSLASPRRYVSLALPSHLLSCLRCIFDMLPLPQSLRICCAFDFPPLNRYRSITFSQAIRVPLNRRYGFLFLTQATWLHAMLFFFFFHFLG